MQILLVEDHKDTARVLGRILKNAGFDVSHADSLVKARELAHSRRFDLVISDVGLPDGSGLDLMRGLRETQGLSGIALSGFGTDDDVAASTAAGFAEHLTKPVDWERLRSAIERLMPCRAERSVVGMTWADVKKVTRVIPQSGITTGASVSLRRETELESPASPFRAALRPRQHHSQTEFGNEDKSERRFLTLSS